MFKKIKTQFAIRKLTKGTAAVLLGLGTLSTNALPIVSAATQENLTEEKTTSSVDIVAGENTDKTENNETPISNKVSTETTAHANSNGESSNESSAVSVLENTTNTEDDSNPNNEISTETSNTKETETEGNGNDDANPSEEDVDNKTEGDKPADKNNSLTQVNIKDFYDENGNIKKDELKNYLNEVINKHPLGIAGAFHLFGENVNILNDTHVAGNVAANKLNVNGSSVGTNEKHTTNLTTGDIFYFDTIKNISSNTGTSNSHDIVIFGPNSGVESWKQNGGQLIITFSNGETKTLDHIKENQVILLESLFDLANEKNPFDFETELENLKNKAEAWASNAPTSGVEITYDPTDGDKRRPIVNISSEAVEEATKNNTPIYVNIPAALLTGGVNEYGTQIDKYEITIQGIPANANSPMIIFNVTDIEGKKDLTVQTNLTLKYNDNTEVTGSSETHSQYNKLLWNFGTNLNTLTIQGDYYLGSILAPYAIITAKVNVDGNIIGKTINIDGETHRWDLSGSDFTPPSNDEHPPTEPDEKPEPEPTPPDKDPEPEPKPTPPDKNPEPDKDTDPTPDTPITTEPKPETLPTKPIFMRPLEKEPTDTVVSNNNPLLSSSTTVIPLSEKITDKVSKKNATTAKNSGMPVSTKTSTDQKSETTAYQAALPQTGKDNTKLIPMGIVMTGIASVLTTLGMAIKKKRN